MSDERRRFFRINDTLGVSCQLLSDKELEAVEAGVALCPVDTFSLIAGYDEKISEYLTELRQRDDVAAKLMEVINKKLDVALNQLEVESRTLQGISHRMKEVSISACGIAFIHDEPLATDAIVSLNLVLKPSNQYIVTYGRVVGSDLCKGGFYARINFQNMEVSDQEMLIQHLVQRQGVQLREDRTGS